MSVPYCPSQTTYQNSSVPAFQAINSQDNSQTLGYTNETITPTALMHQITTLPPFTPQVSTTTSTSQEPSITSMSPSRSATSQELNNQSSNVFLPHSSYSQCHSTNVEGTSTTIADEPNSKDISNYFTQFQNQVSPSNNSSKIPMFSVKNFPQMSPLAQPLGKYLI